MNKDDYDVVRQNYINKKEIDIYNYLTQKQIEILSKLNIIIENKLYTIYDFDIKQSELLKYINNKQKLYDINITDEEYNEIINIFIKYQMNISYTVIICVLHIIIVFFFALF